MSQCAICDSSESALIRVGKQTVCQPCLERVSAEVAAGKRRGRRLVKIVQGKEVAGVCGGLADYMNMDRDTLRVIYAIADLVTGIVPLLVAYLVLALVMPAEEEVPA